MERSGGVHDEMTGVELQETYYNGGARDPSL